MSLLMSVHDITAELPNGSVLFKNFSFSLIKGEKVALIGNNGVGKSMLLSFLRNENRPKNGHIILQGKVSFLPQKINNFNNFTLAEILNVSMILSALSRADKGLANANDINLIGEDWDLRNRIDSILNNLSLNYLTLDRTGSTLSGGELIRCLFARILLENPDFILMDEPTNNLDMQSKKHLFESLNISDAGMLIVSHDRELLNKMDRILEISNLGLRSYGGNFDFYLEQKQIEDKAAIKKIVQAEENLKKQSLLNTELKDKQSHKSSHGKKRALREGMSVIEMKSKEGSAQKTSAHLQKVHEKRVNVAKEKLDFAKEKIRDNFTIHIDIEKSKIPSNKEMLICKDLNFKFQNSEFYFWKENLNFEIIGNKRVSIFGRNGSGKTTLIKLITGELRPSLGEIKIGSKKIAILDQTCSLLEEDQTVLENMQKFGKMEVKTHELRIRAGRFLFYGNDVFKKIKYLSGGERLRAALACLLATNNAPDIFILDEPTNNLDLNSIEVLKNSLNIYRGLLIIISHDSFFLKELNVNFSIYLERYENGFANKK